MGPSHLGGFEVRDGARDTEDLSSPGLGRRWSATRTHDQVFNQPRSLLNAIPGVTQVEMGRCREKGFCCGAGGARMWMEEKIGKRVNMDRTAEALGTGADIVSTACPFCMIMIDDAVKANGREDVRVMDITQVFEQSLLEPVATVPAPAADEETEGPAAE